MAYRERQANPAAHTATTMQQPVLSTLKYTLICPKYPLQMCEISLQCYTLGHKCRNISTLRTIIGRNTWSF